MRKELVATAYIVKDAKVLLMKHKKLGMWLPPGGHVMPEETPDEAAIREVKEETGLDVEILTPKDARGSNPRVKVLYLPHHVQLEDIDEHHQHVDLVYAARVVGGKHVENLAESEGQKWFSATDLDSPEINPNVRHFGKLVLKQFA